VLRFRNDPVWLALCPGQVGAVRAARADAAPAPLGIMDYVAPPRGDASAALLDALRAWLVCNALARSDVHVVLADSLLRYALIPFSATPLSAAEEQALLAARFEQLYGPMPHWRAAVEPQTYGCARVACAIPIALEQGLHALLAEHKVRVKAVTPFFVACFNRARRKIGGASGMLAVVEANNVILGSFGDGGWSGLRAIFVETGAQALEDTIFREKLLQGADPELPVWRFGAPDGSQAPSLAMAMTAAGR
jgi:hypothetical protein